MRFTSRLAASIAALIRRNRTERDLDDELRAFLEASIGAKLAAGMSRADAERAARLELGSPAAVKDWTRDVGWESRLESVWQDVRYAARTLRRTPGFTTIAVLTLALGIGATTAIFTVVEGVILRPLPIADPDRVFTLQQVDDTYTGRTFTYPKYQRLREQIEPLVEGMAASGKSGVLATVRGEARQASAVFVTGEYFDLLGIRPARGRFFVADDHRPGASLVVVVSHAFWRTRMGGDPDVVGQQIGIADTSATVVGIAPRGFLGLELSSPQDIFLPLAAVPLVLPPGNYMSDSRIEIDGLGYSPNNWLDATLRLRSGVAPGQVDAALAPLATPAQASGGAASSLRVVPTSGVALSSRTKDASTQFATWLAIVVSLVLLIGCSNLAGLILARAEERRRETVVRIALGAGALRVVRLFVTESVLLSVMGGVAGLLVAGWMLQAMSHFVIPGSIRLEALQLGLTGRVLLFATAASVLTAILSGVLPALLSSRVEVVSALKTSTGTTSVRRSLTRTTLVATQVAITVVLVVGAVLFVRSLRLALATETGVDAPRLAYARVSFWTAGYDEARLARFNEAIVERLKGQPGIERVSYGVLPLTHFPDSTPAFGIDGIDRRLPQTLVYPAGPDYFETIGIEIVAGRAFERSDARAGVEPVIVVNESFARHAWRGASALGRRVTVEPREDQMVVVGVVRDGKYGSLTEERTPAVFIPWHLAARRAAAARETFIVRGNDPEGVLPLLRHAIGQEDPGLAIMTASTLEERVAELAMTQRIGASLLGWFSAAAFALALLGIYGLVAYAVARRTNEIGMHIALGAEPGDVVRRMMLHSLAPVGIGVVAGVAGAFALSRSASAFLFGVAPHDPLSFAAATAFLLLAAGIASYIPARRAARVDPLVALRAE
jgi:predicted permease